MTDPGPVLDAVQAAIADWAAVLAAVRSGLGGECDQAGRHLEMSELDLLSARDAVEKARLDIDAAGLTVAGVRVTVPSRERSTVLRSAAPPSVAGAVSADVASGGCRADGGPGRGGAGSRDPVRKSCSQYTTSRCVPCS